MYAQKFLNSRMVVNELLELQMVSLGLAGNKIANFCARMINTISINS